MIPDLLWRCPLCASNDALRHSQRWLHPEVVDCTACGAQWRVRRVVGDNYYLKITRSGGYTTAYSPGFELSITAWYDLMKQTVHLEALPEPPNLLEVGEKLYLASGQATLWAEAQPAFSRADPLQPCRGGDQPSIRYRSPGTRGRGWAGRPGTAVLNEPAHDLATVFCDSGAPRCHLQIPSRSPFLCTR